MSNHESEHPDNSYLPPDPLGVPDPHDILAAEEFGIGTRDNRWPASPNGNGPPRDVLAAEEFIIGTRDSRWPRDPSGYDTPHDILAAEAFPMPLPDAGREETAGGPALGVLAAGLLAFAAVRLVRRR